MTHDDTGGSVPALRTTGLGKRYGRQVWGLRDCSLTDPARRRRGPGRPERRGQDDAA